MRIRKGFKTHLMKTDAKYVNTSYIADRLDANYYSDKYLVIEQQIKNSGYKVVKYHDICDVIKCGPFGSSVLAENYNDTGIIMIRPLNLKEVLLSEDELVRFPEESLGTDFPVFEAGDILFARVGTPSCSIIPNSIEKVTISPNIIASKLKKTINKYYVALFLNTDYGLNQLERRFKAVSQPTISTDEIKTIDIVLPNVHIQNYIGNKIRKAEELREEAKRLKDEAESLLSLVLKLDEFKYESTKSWVVNAEFLEPYLNVQFYNKEYLSFQKHLKSLGISLFKMSQVLYKIIKNNSPDENDRVEKGIPSLIVSDIDPYRIEIENAKIQVSQDYYKANEHQAICVDDVVYTTAGPPLGEACLVVDEMLPLLSGAHVAVLRTNEKCKPGYLTCVLNSLVGFLEVQKHSYGIRQQYLFNEQLSNFVIPVIAQEIQDEIHEKISKAIKFEIQSKKFISEAKQDVEDLIEGKFDESKISEGV